MMPARLMLHRKFASVALMLAACMSLFAPTAHAETRGPLVLAAASLQESLTAAADRWTAKGHSRPVLSFAASSALARQITSGAPADLFISADEDWMDHVAARGLIRAKTRTSFLGNRLVLIAPKASRVRLTIGRRFPLAGALGSGRLAMADPGAVPAGRYGQAALEHYAVWRDVSGKVALAENVRAALAFVARSEAPLGIVYATDARASRAVRVVAVFPAQSHPAITYPVAVLTSSTHAEAAGFRAYLLSREGRAIFARYGFSAP